VSLQVRGCLGSGATAVFANDDDVWKEFQKAGSITGDRLWRLPLWDHYSENVTGENGVRETRYHPVTRSHR